MEITLTGFLVIFFLIILLVNEGKRIFIDPKLYILALYWAHWGKVEKINIMFPWDFMLALSFLIFYSTAYCVSRNSKIGLGFYQRLSTRMHWDRPFTPLSKITQWSLVFWVLVFVVFNLYANSIIYGSLNDALTRFYVKQPMSTLPSYYGVLLGIMLVLSMLFVFVLRLSSTLFSQSRIPFYICVFLFLIITVPGGARGSVMALFAITIFADLIASVKYRISWRKSVLSFSSIFILCVCLFFFFFMSFMRNDRVDNVGDLITRINSFEINEGQEAYAEAETDLMMSDYYYTCEHFGNDKKFLPLLSSATAIVVNWIPRSIWPDKPIGFGRRYAMARMGIDYTNNALASSAVSSFAVGICGEGWANGGLKGVIFYSVVVGLYAGVLIRLFFFLLAQNGYIPLMLALLFYQASGSYIRGDLLSGITQGLYPIVLLSILLYVYSKIKQSYSHN